MANLLTKGDTKFKDSATKFFGWKSGELKGLITALEAYQDAMSADNLNRLFSALIQWFRHHPKEIKPVNRGARARELLLEVMSESQSKGFGLDMKAAGWQPSPITLIASVLDELNKCKDFVCSDAAQFAGDINPDIPRQQQDRILQRAQQSGRATGLAEIPRHDRGLMDWNRESIQRAHTEVYSKRAGECTSFGKAAAHLLSTASMTPFMPRIEVLAFSQHQKRPRYNRDGTPMMIRKPNEVGLVHAHMSVKIAHVFCVVGRQGAALTHPDTWNPEARVVDCWLGSLGYECVFTVPDYPKRGYFTNLEVVMDSYQGPDAVF